MYAKAKQVSALILGAAIGITYSATGGAHHSALAMYSMDQEVVLEGEVTRFRLINPHSTIDLDVKDPKTGEVVSWVAEGDAASVLKREGWEPERFKPGMKLTISVHPARSGKKLGAWIKIQESSSGKVLANTGGVGLTADQTKDLYRQFDERRREERRRREGLQTGATAVELDKLAVPASSWVSGTLLGAALQREPWLVLPAQFIHIVALAILTACTVTISLRILGVQRLSGRSVPMLIQTLLPWIYGCLGVLLLTGGTQILLEPMREFSSPAFWLKLPLILMVLAYTIWFARTARAHATEWNESRSYPVAAKIFAASSLMIWIAIIFCGRFIAYTHK